MSDVKMGPKFSIIIPVFNSEEHIGKCLKSLTEQKYLDFEVILVNDGSNDQSEEIIQRICSSKLKGKYRLFSQGNSGAGAARNRGISLAQGQYIVFVDSDDYLDERFLDKVNDTIASENSDIVFIDIIREDRFGNILRYEKMSDFSLLSKEKMIRAQLTGKMPWGGVRKVIRSSIIKNNNLNYATIKVGEESIFSFRALEEATVISFQPEAIYHYVDAENSLTNLDTPTNSLVVFDYVYNFLLENGKLEKYRDTVASLSITTVVVCANVLSVQKSFFVACKEGKKILINQAKHFRNKIDWKSLDPRVKIFLPFIKAKTIWPIVVMGKILGFFRKIKRRIRRKP